MTKATSATLSAVCLVAMILSSAAAEVPMLRLGGTPQEIGRIWGRINRRAVHRDMDLFLGKAAAEGIAADALVERSARFVQIARQIAPHWLDEARAVAQAAGVDAELYVGLLGVGPRGLFLHECTSYAIARAQARGGAILFHKNRDNVLKEQAAFILESSRPGINKFMAVCDASNIACSMMVNDKGLAGSADYPGGLKPEKAEPQYRGVMNSLLLRHVAERASSCPEALALIQEMVKKGYYAGGRVNETHWLFVDRQGVILEVSNNARHVAWRHPTEKVYFSMREKSAAAARLRDAAAPVDFHLFHNVSRDRSICVKSSVCGMTVEIDPDHPELLTCGWISLPARAVSFPLLMGQARTPACLISGDAYVLGASSCGTSPLWERAEQAAHASKQLVRDKILASGAQAAGIAERWSQSQAQTLIELLRSR